MDSNIILTSFNSKKEEIINNYNIRKREINLIYAIRHAGLLNQSIEGALQFDQAFRPTDRIKEIGKYIVLNDSPKDSSHSSYFIMSEDLFIGHLFFFKKEDIYIDKLDEKYYDIELINKILEEYGLGVNVRIEKENEIIILFDPKKVKDKNNEQKRGSSRTLKP